MVGPNVLSFNKSGTPQVGSVEEFDVVVIPPDLLVGAGLRFDHVHRE